ncbi:MAG: SMP-30/gluconolactonase/LRE family protein [Pseudomonadales bacterium]|nr:SMP-30/gluconolactonase/LRE family protein [Pseudomonadales bacterium]
MMKCNLSEIAWSGESLYRPECVLATRAGYKYVSDSRGGVTEISPYGTQRFFGGEQVPGYGLLKPNGIALLANGDFLIAHLGDTRGGIFRITREGNCSAFVTEINGEPIPPTNFIYLDRQGRLWFTVSTRVEPRADAYSKDVADGFIALIDNGEARIVADDIGYTNEVYVDPDGQHLYVNATFSRELICYQINADNDLQHPSVVTRFSAGTYPDGLTRDQQDNFWVTSIVSNRLLRVSPEGRRQIVLEDSDREHLQWVEEAFQSGQMGRPHLDNIKSQCLKNISSLAFSGADLSIMNFGCLLGDKIGIIDTAQSAAATVHGVAPAHWHFDDHRACCDD